MSRAIPFAAMDDEPVPELFGAEDAGAVELPAKSSAAPKNEQQPVEKMEYLGPIRRRTVVFEKTYGIDSKIVLRELEGIEAVDGSVLLEGFPAVSITPLLVSSYIVEQQKLPLLAVCNSTEFPSRCVVERGQPGAPVRIFGNEHICIWLSEFQISPSVTPALVEALFDFAARHRCRLVVTTEGLPSDSIPSEKPVTAPVYFLSTDDKLAKALIETKAVPIPSAIIDGVTGAVLAECIFRTQEVLCLLTPTNRRYPDARAALTILRTLNAVVLSGVQIDLGPMENKALELERDVRAAIERAKPSHRMPVPTMMYG